MKQLLILSGKGGTGKTTVAGAFIKLSKADAYADCDVDAPNLHLAVSNGNLRDKSDFYGLPKASINPEKCTSCGICFDNCRFDAIKTTNGYSVDTYSCEGCGVCAALCPAGAISMDACIAGDLMLYGELAVFSTARLRMGSGNSGLLVTEVRNRLSKAAPGAPYAIIDGSPGIGCPVIASLTGVDMVLIVAEPSLSGISDMQRVIETAKIFMIETVVCINKYDINIRNTEKIESLCKDAGIPVSGRIPYDEKVIHAVNNGMSIVELDCPAGDAIRTVFEKTMEIFQPI
ncbi:MAG: ATP-binding protein [Clostridia bacterium]